MTTHRNHHLDRILGPLYRPGPPSGPFRTPGALVKNNVEVWASRDVITEAELRGTDSAGGQRDISHGNSTWIIRFEDRALFRLGDLFLDDDGDTWRVQSGAPLDRRRYWTLDCEDPGGVELPA